MDLLAPLRHLGHRPSLLIGGAAGLLAGFAGHAAVPGTSSLLLGWAGGVAVYLAYVARVAGRTSVAEIQKRADLLDEGGIAILVITVGAGVASLAAIIAELVRAKGEAHSDLAVAFAALTVVLSWMFVHTVFAFHYAHEYYASDHPGDYCLDFPSTENPIYWDFIYFSFVIGMTAQVADVQTKTVAVRKLVLAHGIIAFFFNTAVLALGVNLAASLAS